MLIKRSNIKWRYIAELNKAFTSEVIITIQTDRQFVRPCQLMSPAYSITIYCYSPLLFLICEHFSLACCGPCLPSPIIWSRTQNPLSEWRPAHVKNLSQVSSEDLQGLVRAGGQVVHTDIFILTAGGYHIPPKRKRGVIQHSFTLCHGRIYCVCVSVCTFSFLKTVQTIEPNN